MKNLLRYTLTGILATTPLSTVWIGTGSALVEEKFDNPKEFIQSLGAKAIQSLTDRGVPLSQRKVHFAELLDVAFDVPSIASFVLGRYWRLATPEERKEYVTLFRSMLIEAYASKFEGYNDIKIVTTGVRGDDSSGYVVSTSVHVPDMSELKLDWKVFPSDGKQSFRILDIVIDNVSMSITQRSEFASIIQNNNGSIRAFLDVLSQKVKDLETGAAVAK
jgi:phospholipid transport system substrate-binding protein